MTLLGNDLLVCGGGQTVSSCALYNASINEWASAATIPPLPVTGGYYPMVTLHTRPYVFGGFSGTAVLNTVYTLDTSNAWATRTPMIQAVMSHTAVAIDTNTALECGGFHNGTVLSVCSSYAATKDVWSPAAQMITARLDHGMAVYKGLFAVEHDLHNYGGCAQVACLSMADSMAQAPCHLWKCCRSTRRRGQHCQRPCSRPHMISSLCHCLKHKTTFNYCE